MNQVSARSIVPLRRMLAALFFVAVMLVAPRMALAGGVPDQVSPVGDGDMLSNFNAGTSNVLWQQQIQVGVAGPLVGIAIELVGVAGDTTNLRIRKGAAPSTQPVVFQQIVTKTVDTTQSILVDTSSALLSFAVGDIFVMEIQGTNGSTWIHGSDVAPPGQPLYSQPLFEHNDAYVGLRLGFTTYVGCTNDVQCDDQNVCTDDTCAVASGMCVHTNNTLSCTDGDTCTQNDVCADGTCTGTPVVCSAVDGCHTAGVCNPMTGVCSNPAKPDGIPCGNGICVAGTCSDESGNTTSVTSSTSGGGTSTTGSASAGSAAREPAAQAPRAQAARAAGPASARARRQGSPARRRPPAAAMNRSPRRATAAAPRRAPRLRARRGCCSACSCRRCAAARPRASLPEGTSAMAIDLTISIANRGKMVLLRSPNDLARGRQCAHPSQQLWCFSR